MYFVRIKPVLLTNILYKSILINSRKANDNHKRTEGGMGPV